MSEIILNDILEKSPQRYYKYGIGFNLKNKLITCHIRHDPHIPDPHPSNIVDILKEYECFVSFNEVEKLKDYLFNKWAKQYRKISKEEMILCGFDKKKKDTYFVPVIRPKNEFTLTPRQFL